jgi:hypothetical protein
MQGQIGLMNWAASQQHFPDATVRTKGKILGQRLKMLAWCSSAQTVRRIPNR